MGVQVSSPGRPDRDSGTTAPAQPHHGRQILPAVPRCSTLHGAAAEVPAPIEGWGECGFRRRCAHAIPTNVGRNLGDDLVGEAIAYRGRPSNTSAMSSAY